MPRRSQPEPATLTANGAEEPDSNPPSDAPATPDLGGLNDWADCGWVSVLPVLAEHAVAELLWSMDPGTHWLGGNNPGFDVRSTAGRVDAKRAWVEGDGERLGFGAPRKFDPTKVDIIAPVLLATEKIGYEVLADGGGRMTASYESARIWMIPVDEVNQMLNWRGNGASWVPLKAVAKYEVTRPGRPLLASDHITG